MQIIFKNVIYASWTTLQKLKARLCSCQKKKKKEKKRREKEKRTQPADVLLYALWHNVLLHYFIIILQFRGITALLCNTSEKKEGGEYKLKATIFWAPNQ